MATTTSYFLGLDNDALEAVLLSTPTKALGSLMQTNKQLLSAISAQPLLQRLCELRKFSSGPSTLTSSTSTQFHCSSDVVDSLEAVAVLEAMTSESLSKNHIAFHLASLSMTNPSKMLLNHYLTLLRRHPKLELRIDSHWSRRATPGPCVAQRSPRLGRRRVAHRKRGRARADERVRVGIPCRPEAPVACAP